MKKKGKARPIIGVGMILLFVIWTVLLRFVDMRPIGAENTPVGFGALNSLVHRLTGVNWFLYQITDLLGLLPITLAVAFAVLGLAQLIKRKSIFLVDRDILITGGFYAVVIGVYALFEALVINYRPILIEGRLEASYPSSTTLLVICVMLSALIQTRLRIKRPLLGRLLRIAIILFIAFMVIGRILSGVHWITDIIGGAILSLGLVLIYDHLLCNYCSNNSKKI